MGKDWSYSKHAKLMKKCGGPEAFDRALYKKGYDEGKKQQMKDDICYSLCIFLLVSAVEGGKKAIEKWHKKKADSETLEKESSDSNNTPVTEEAQKTVTKEFIAYHSERERSQS